MGARLGKFNYGDGFRLGWCGKCKTLRVGEGEKVSYIIMRMRLFRTDDFKRALRDHEYHMDA